MPTPNREFSITNVRDDEQQVWDLGNDNLTFGQVVLFITDPIPPHENPSGLIYLTNELDKLDVGEYHYRIGDEYRYTRTA